VATHRLFAYGTLEIPELVGALTGRRLRSEAAVLEGYARRMLRDEPYPGLAPMPGSRTSGTVYEDLDAHSLDLLDLYEGPHFERYQVHVRMAGGRRRRAFAYVLRPEQRHLLTDEPWDAERFRSHELPAYLHHCAGLRRSADHT
jgi:gamma-glutamylcyclotransferase (GGCT)/AIG2-like uncharacterized protein YtfP